MDRTVLRFILAAYAFYVVVVLSGLVVITRAIIAEGVVRVDVAEKWPGNARITIPVPAAFANAVLTGAALAHDERDLDFHFDSEAEAWAPAIRAALAEIESTPDMVLLEARDGDERVTVSKEKGELVIRVDGHEADVKITVPKTTVRRAANLVRG